jgi:hypothetical protein
MQLTAMAGFPGLAGDIAIVLLGLDPPDATTPGDPFHTLLHLDTLLATSLRLERLIEYTIGPAGAADLARLQTADAVTTWAINSALSSSPWMSPLIIARSHSQVNSKVHEQEVTGLEVLPNWWMSLALGAFLAVSRNTLMQPLSGADRQPEQRSKALEWRPTP